nr:ribonuclease H-like domain-containing protein [Tanacetum cinerariifolium]
MVMASKTFLSNFNYINLLSKKDVVIGLPKLKYVKDQLCSSCELSKAKRSSFKLKVVPSLKGRLNLLHMDLCGPMRVSSINGKKYILSVQLILFIVESGCTKHMTGNLKLLCNFVKKFLGAVRFGNDQFAPILGYGDLHMTGNLKLLCNFVEKFLGSNPQDKQPTMNNQPTSAPSTPIYVHAEENNNDRAEEGEHVQDDKFTNPFCTPVQEEAEYSDN